LIFDFEPLRTNRSYLCAERASHLTVKTNDEKELPTRSPPQTDRKMPAETFWCNFSGFGSHLCATIDRVPSSRYQLHYTNSLNQIGPVAKHQIP